MVMDEQPLNGRDRNDPHLKRIAKTECENKQADSRFAQNGGEIIGTLSPLYIHTYLIYSRENVDYNNSRRRKFDACSTRVKTARALHTPSV